MEVTFYIGCHKLAVFQQHSGEVRSTYLADLKALVVVFQLREDSTITHRAALCVQSQLSIMPVISCFKDKLKGKK